MCKGVSAWRQRHIPVFLFVTIYAVVFIMLVNERLTPKALWLHLSTIAMKGGSLSRKFVNIYKNEDFYVPKVFSKIDFGHL